MEDARVFLEIVDAMKAVALSPRAADALARLVDAGALPRPLHAALALTLGARAARESINAAFRARGASVRLPAPLASLALRARGTRVPFHVLGWETFVADENVPPAFGGIRPYRDGAGALRDRAGLDAPLQKFESWPES